MEYAIDPWELSSQVIQTRMWVVRFSCHCCDLNITHSGFSCIDGDNLFISNLCNGLDLYSLRTMQCIRHYECPVTINVPLQLALARQVLDWVVMGGVDGIVRVYDCATGELVRQLKHKDKGHVQIVDVSVIQISYLLWNQ